MMGMYHTSTLNPKPCMPDLNLQWDLQKLQCRSCFAVKLAIAVQNPIKNTAASITLTFRSNIARLHHLQLSTSLGRFTVH